MSCNEASSSAAIGAMHAVSPEIGNQCCDGGQKHYRRPAFRLFGSKAKCQVKCEQRLNNFAARPRNAARALHSKCSYLLHDWAEYASKMYSASPASPHARAGGEKGAVIMLFLPGSEFMHVMKCKLARKRVVSQHQESGLAAIKRDIGELCSASCGVSGEMAWRSEWHAALWRRGAHGA